MDLSMFPMVVPGPKIPSPAVYLDLITLRLTGEDIWL